MLPSFPNEDSTIVPLILFVMFLTPFGEFVVGIVTQVLKVLHTHTDCAVLNDFVVFALNGIGLAWVGIVARWVRHLELRAD